MAERRMFAKTIIDSDAFTDMPLSTQALYFHLSMRADDDGFLNNPKKIQRMIGCSDDDLKLLLAKRFLIPFDSGVVVIKHWKIHNYIRNDRYKPTVYAEEKAQLFVKPNGAYTLDSSNGIPLVYQTDTNCLPSGIPTDIPSDDHCETSGIPSDNQVTYQMDTQVRLGKDRLGKVSIGEENKDTDMVTDDLSFMNEKKKTKKENLASVLDDCGVDGELRDALNDFIKMRKAKKKPLTERALRMVITKLKGLSDDIPTQVAIVNQSVLHTWDTVYELKSDKPWKPINSPADVQKRFGANGIELNPTPSTDLDFIFGEG